MIIQEGQVQVQATNKMHKKETKNTMSLFHERSGEERYKLSSSQLTQLALGPRARAPPAAVFRAQKRRAPKGLPLFFRTRYHQRALKLPIFHCILAYLVE